MVAPTWLPDEYAAWMWRAYHSANPDLKLTAPIVEYKKSGDRKECGLGYGNVMKAGAGLTFAAESNTKYAKVEFHDGDRIVGIAEQIRVTVRANELTGLDCRDARGTHHRPFDRKAKSLRIRT